MIYNFSILKLAKYAEISFYSENDFIYKKGDINDRIYLIIHGEVEIIYRNLDSESDELAYDLLSDNSYFGESSLVTQTPHTTSVFIMKLKKKHTY
jgi:CRP-like cAMP-binding protein